jgi:hypothetical protein
MPGVLIFDKLPGMFIVVLAGELRDRAVQPWLAAIVGDQRAMLDRFGTVPELRIFATTDEPVIAFTTTDGR